MSNFTSNFKKSDEEFASLFNNLVCPISNKLMIEPVVSEDGKSYEKEELNNLYINSKGMTSSIYHKIFPNIALAKQIDTMIKDKSFPEDIISDFYYRKSILLLNKGFVENSAELGNEIAMGLMIPILINRIEIKKLENLPTKENKIKNQLKQMYYAKKLCSKQNFVGFYYMARFYHEGRPKLLFDIDIEKPLDQIEEDYDVEKLENFTHIRPDKAVQYYNQVLSIVREIAIKHNDRDYQDEETWDRYLPSISFFNKFIVSRFSFPGEIRNALHDCFYKKIFNYLTLYRVKDYIRNCNRFLGIMHYKKRTLEVKATDTQIFSYFQIASRLNDPISSYYLANCYYYGLGVKQNYFLAYSSYQKCTDIVIYSNIMLAIMNIKGQGITEKLDDVNRIIKGLTILNSIINSDADIHYKCVARSNINRVSGSLKDVNLLNASHNFQPVDMFVELEFNKINLHFDKFINDNVSVLIGDDKSDWSVSPDINNLYDNYLLWYKTKRTWVNEKCRNKKELEFYLIENYVEWGVEMPENYRYTNLQIKQI